VGVPTVIGAGGRRAGHRDRHEPRGAGDVPTVGGRGARASWTPARGSSLVLPERWRRASVGRDEAMYSLRASGTFCVNADTAAR
jgi:hypothetical protein